MRDHHQTGLPRSLSLGQIAAKAAALPLRGKVIGWLFMFIIAYRMGLPVLYSAALAAVPWLLLRRPERRHTSPR